MQLEIQGNLNLGKSSILHLSYPQREFGEPTFFTMCILSIKLNNRKFEEIFLSRTITNELS